MFKKVVCVFIFFAFLLVKNTSLFMMLKNVPESSVCQENSASNDASENENDELKSFDDFIHEPILYLRVVFTSHKLIEQPVLKMTIPYTSKLYTPPDLAS